MISEEQGRFAGPTESETRTGSAAPLSDAPVPALLALDERRKEKGDVWLWRTTLTSVAHTSDANTAR